jgi:hypothetical protein
MTAADAFASDAKAAAAAAAAPGASDEQQQVAHCQQEEQQLQLQGRSALVMYQKVAVAQELAQHSADVLGEVVTLMEQQILQGQAVVGADAVGRNSMFRKLVQAVKKVPRSIAGGAAGLLHVARVVPEAVGHAAVSTAQHATHAVVDGVVCTVEQGCHAVGAVGGAAKGAVGAVVGTTQDAVGAAADAAAATGHAAGSVVKGVVHGTQQAVVGTAHAVEHATDRVIGGAKDVVQGTAEVAAQAAGAA